MMPMAGSQALQMHTVLCQATLLCKVNCCNAINTCDPRCKALRSRTAGCRGLSSNAFLSYCTSGSVACCSLQATGQQVFCRVVSPERKLCLPEPNQ